MKPTPPDADRYRLGAEPVALSEQRFRAVFENAGLAIVIADPQRRIVDCNDAMARWLGYSRSELRGKAIGEISHQEDEARNLRLAEEATARPDGPSTIQSEKRYVRKDGATVWGLVSISIGRGADGEIDFFVGMIQDITEQKRVEEALRESEERYRLLFELESDAIFVIENATGRILAANQAASELYGYRREELLRLRNADLSAEPEETTRVTRQTPVADQVVHVPIRYHRKRDGTVFPVEITGRFLTLEGRSVHIAAIRDASERQRSEEERRRLEEQVRHVQKLESLGVLAGGIAHDFNNLLMAVLGNADLALLRLPAANPARDNVREIATAAERAADLCRQMLAYAGKGPFQVGNVDLTGLVREMGDILKVSVSKRAACHYDLDPELPPVQADPSQLRQVVMNLITNASEALEGETGVISVSTGQVECRAADFRTSYLGEELPPGSYVFFEVRDTGCGMDAETRQRIFDPFFSTKFAGRGLGLAAVLGIVRGHGGAIAVESEPGAGAAFRVLLPAASGEAAPGPDRGNAGRAPGHRGTVLLVDDEEYVRQVAKGMLEALGYRVLLAADGDEAVRVFRQHGAEVGWVLLDLTMPRMGGEETFQALRGIREDVPVVLSSGYEKQEVAARFEGKAFSGFIQKPYTLARLRSVLGEASER